MEYIILIVVLAVLIVGIGGTMLLRPGRGRRVGRGRAGGDVTPGGGTGTLTDSGTRTAEPETGAAPGGPTVVVPPAGPVPPPAPAKPVLEKPPPSAGRMVRLRARLAKSQRASGRRCLACCPGTGSTTTRGTRSRRS